MADKKSETRFTLGFNQNDPDHVHVAELLNLKGRQKAKFIVDAILFYENNGSPVLRSERIDEKMIENIVKRLLGDNENNKPSEKSKPKTTETANFEIDTAMDTLGKNGMDSISRAMAAFRGE